MSDDPEQRTHDAPLGSEAQRLEAWIVRRLAMREETRTTAISDAAPPSRARQGPKVQAPKAVAHPTRSDDSRTVARAMSGATVDVGTLEAHRDHEAALPFERLTTTSESQRLERWVRHELERMAALQARPVALPSVDALSGMKLRPSRRVRSTLSP